MTAPALLFASASTIAAHEVFVTNERDNTVSVIDTASFHVTAIDVAKLRAIRSVKVGRFPWGVVVRRDGPPAKP